MPQNSLNFRDIGGLRALGGHTRDGILFRSEGPRNFAPEQLAALGAMGFRSIVDLRSAHERKEAPHTWHGPDCQWLGLDVNADLRVFGHYGREQLQKGPDPEIAVSTMCGTFREIVGALVPHWPTIARTFLGGDVPVLLNCTAGKDRTGVAIALLLELVGVSREDIVEDYLRSQIFSDNLKRSGDLEAGLLGTFGFMPSPGQVDALIGVRAEYLEAAWDEIAQGWSDLPTYFAVAGLALDEQKRIRDLLVS